MPIYTNPLRSSSSGIKRVAPTTPPRQSVAIAERASIQKNSRRANRMREPVERGNVGGPDHRGVNPDRYAHRDSREHTRPSRRE